MRIGVQVLASALLLGCGPGEVGRDSSYRLPASKPWSAAPIAEVHFDYESHIRLAPGSDNWPLTWDADGHQYTSFGDGGGFGGTNRLGRVSLGVARIEGDPGRYYGVNVWGGQSAERPASFPGKSYGILSLDDRLYMFVAPGSGADNYLQQKLYVSSDRGASWEPADWAFTAAERVSLPGFCQFGRNYAEAPDDRVYVFAPRLDDPLPEELTSQREGKLDLFRVGRDHLLERSAWEFYAGVDEAGKPRWTAELDARQPVFSDPGRSLSPRVSVIYNPGLRRYLLAAEQDGSREGNLALFEAPEPWGPWRRIASYRNWGGFGRSFYWNFAPKWFSPDGRHFVLVFTGRDENDSWNSVRGRFVLEDEIGEGS